MCRYYYADDSGCVCEGTTDALEPSLIAPEYQQTACTPDTSTIAQISGWWYYQWI